MRIFGYMRASTDDQVQGMRAQRDAIQATADQLAGRAKAPVVWFVDEGVSGATPWQKRPALSELVMSLETKDVLVVQRRDRLARDAIQAMMLDRLVRNVGARIESADGAKWDDTPESTLIRGILDLFSQYERQLIGMRTKRALEAKRARGERLGGLIPYGMRINKDNKQILEVDPLTWANIQKFIMRPHAQGVGFREIAHECNRMKVKFPPMANRWSKSTVHRIWHYHMDRLARVAKRDQEEHENNIIKEAKDAVDQEERLGEGAQGAEGGA